MGIVAKVHWKPNGRVPLAATKRLVGVPALTVMGFGWLLITGGTKTLTVNSQIKTFVP